MDGSHRLPLLPALRLARRVFAALLDDERAAASASRPRSTTRASKQLYLPDTNVLLTRFLADEGVGEITDFMPIERRAHGRTAGPARRRRSAARFRFRMRCAPRFDYARAAHAASRPSSDGAASSCGAGPADACGLRSPDVRSARRRGGAASREFALEAGRVGGLRPARMREPASHRRRPRPTIVARRCSRTRSTSGGAGSAARPTAAAGARWCNRSALDAEAADLRADRLDRRGADLRPARDARRRAQLGLPLHLDPRRLVHALRAHPPRLHRRGRALHATGSRRAAASSRADGPLQIMYGIDGRARAPRGGPAATWRATAARGRCASATAALRAAPARHLRRADGLGLPLQQVRRARSRTTCWTQPAAARRLGRATHWREPDEGIWEVRGGRRQFVYSRVMCWVALDRGLRLADKRSLPGARRSAGTRSRDAIYQEHLRGLLGPERQRASSSTRARRRSTPSTLLMPLVLFIAPDRPALALDADAPSAAASSSATSSSTATIARRARPTGSRGAEGTFNMCSFWYVECLARAGDLAAGALPLREDARLRQPPRPLRRRARSQGRAPRQLPAGVHPPGPDQRRLLPRPGAVQRPAPRLGGVNPAGVQPERPSSSGSRVNSSLRTLDALQRVPADRYEPGTGPARDAAAAKAEEISTSFSTERHRAAMRLASLTAGPTTVKSSRSVAADIAVEHLADMKAEIGFGHRQPAAGPRRVQGARSGSASAARPGARSGRPRRDRRP